MKFMIGNMNRLKSDVEVLDEDDRITIIAERWDGILMEYTFRIRRTAIFLISERESKVD